MTVQRVPGWQKLCLNAVKNRAGSAFHRFVMSKYLIAFPNSP